MPKPNYQRDKRQRDLARQRKQEEKRQKKTTRPSPDDPSESAETPGADDLHPGLPGDGVSPVGPVQDPG